MNINATLIFQAVAFAIFVWLTMKYVWPPLLKIMEDRKARIAEGLAAAERGAKALQEASLKSEQELKAARAQAQEIVGAAGKQASRIVEQARAAAEAERARILAAGQAEVERQIAQAREALRREVGALAVAGAAKILQREIDAKTHADVLGQLASQI